MRGLLENIARLWCAFRGHDVLLKVEADRMSLRCSSCSYESPGWELNLPRPVRFRANVIRFRKRLSA